MIELMEPFRCFAQSNIIGLDFAVTLSSPDSFWFLHRILFEVVVGLITCGGVICGQGAKVLSGSTQGIYPRHWRSWRCRTPGTARWQERRRGRRWSEGRSRRDQKQRSLHAWMTMGWTETQTWATVCVHLKRKTVKGQRHKLTTKRDYENEGSWMHDGSCIGINYAHRFPKCFRSLHTLLGFSICTSCRQFNLLLYQFIPFLTCTRIPCRDSHCENGSFEVLSLHPPSVTADNRQL